LVARQDGEWWSEPEELAGVAVLRATAVSAFVNGQVLYVDGGLLATL
jgi:gluconate 5-dehydrogenase